jgi:hypothetical protein
MAEHFSLRSLGSLNGFGHCAVRPALCALPDTTCDMPHAKAGETAWGLELLKNRQLANFYYRKGPT